MLLSVLGTMTLKKEEEQEYKGRGWESNWVAVSGIHKYINV
jgi:hypothetical protein